jgi:iodotyrosine deiodinase
MLTEENLNKYKVVPHSQYREFSAEEMKKRSQSFLQEMGSRRTVRQFSNKPVSREIIENCLQVAGTAPSGANQQPWHFVVVNDPQIKKEIRMAAEKEEKDFYQGKAPQEWLDALAPLGTDENKSFLEIAPHLIVIFAESYRLLPDGKKGKNYYVTESVGIATGMLITAVHQAGLVSLTHTPSPMNFLNKILNRPDNERPFLILVVGHPEENVSVPQIDKKPLKDFTTFI